MDMLWVIGKREKNIREPKLAEKEARIFQNRKDFSAQIAEIYVFL